MEVPRTEFSQRALALLQTPRFESAAPPTPHGERQYDDGKLIWWAGKDSCEGFGHHGPWSETEKVLWEAAGVMLKGQKWGRWQEISSRELEFFLRDKNSQRALPEEALESFHPLWIEIQSVVVQWLQSGVSLAPYIFTHKVAFRDLSLRDKIHELKAFFLSDKLSPFYQRGGKLEVLDVQDCTVYLALDTADIPQGAFLDWLQIMSAETFHDPTINLIPEAFPSTTGKKTV